MTGLVDLLENLRRVGATAGGEWCGPCPWCGGTDRFRVWPDHPAGRERWWCRRCNRQGDIIDLLRERDGLNYREATFTVGKPIQNMSLRSPRDRSAPTLSPPCQSWQARADKFAQIAEKALWAPQGYDARAYLRRRGIREETLRAARLGYNPLDTHEEPQIWSLPEHARKVWLPRGVVIPWRVGNDLWRVNVRRSKGRPKYIGPAGFRNGLYGADGIRPNRPLVIVEGEFDALAVAQEANDLVSVVATGSTQGGRHHRWVSRLELASVILVAYDGDDAGDQASRWWLSSLSRAMRWRPEVDPADMLERRADLRGWVKRGLQQVKVDS